MVVGFELLDSFCAGSTNSENLNVVALHLESGWRAALQTDRRDIAGRKVFNRLAAKTDKMMVRLRIGFETSRPMVRADFMDQPVLLKCLQIFINGRKRD